jgi:hypothetical protein
VPPRCNLPLAQNPHRCGARVDRNHKMNDSDDVDDIDLAETLVELNTQEVAYQGALRTTARVIQTTLREFLR